MKRMWWDEVLLLSENLDFKTSTNMAPNMIQASIHQKNNDDLDVYALKQQSFKVQENTGRKKFNRNKGTDKSTITVKKV